MELINKQISPEANAKVEITAGKIQISAALDSQGVDAEVKVSVDAEYFLDELAKKIPGVIDDAILGVIKTAVKAL